MIGHSQGGIQAVKVLHDLRGRLGRSELHPFNPADQAVRGERRRSSIRSPAASVRLGFRLGLVADRRHGRLGARAAEPLDRARPRAQHSRTRSTSSSATGSASISGRSTDPRSTRSRRSTRTEAPSSATCGSRPSTRTSWCRRPATSRQARRCAPGSTPTCRTTRWTSRAPGALARGAERQRHLRRQRLVRAQEALDDRGPALRPGASRAAAGRRVRGAPGRGAGRPLEVKFACRGPGRHGRRAHPRAPRIPGDAHDLP